MFTNKWPKLKSWLLLSILIISATISISQLAKAQQAATAINIPSMASKRPKQQQQQTPATDTNSTTARASNYEKAANRPTQTTTSKRKQSSGGSRNSALRTSRTSQQQQQRSAGQQDPFALAQQQARLMIGYNNTPPLFVTGTRDLFVDVSRYPLGTKLTTIKALDLDGDPLEYSLQPANLNDASPYFSIDPTSGELRLAHKQFVLRSSDAIFAQGERIETVSATSTNKTDSEEGGEEEEEEEEEEKKQKEQEGREDEQQSEDDQGQQQQEHGQNLYFLNVVANDGRYPSVVELLIHFINSSSLAALQASGRGLPVQLTPEGSRRATEKVDSLIRRKISESFQQTRSSKSGNSSSPALVYPNFFNPSIVRPDNSLAEQTVSDLASMASIMSSTTTPATATQANIPAGTDIGTQLATTPPQGEASIQQMSLNANLKGSPPVQAIEQSPEAALVVGTGREPMLVSLILVCSCLTIALVLLMFIIPLSVKRLRRRLKQVVSVQHEHLSQRASLSGASSTSGSMATHTHAPSLSQFTLSSDRSCVLSGSGLTGARNSSSVCRQLSLDSSVSIMATDAPQQRQQAALHFIAPTAQAQTQMLFSRPLNRVNNGSIANPVYLDQHQQLSEDQLVQQRYLLSDDGLINQHHKLNRLQHLSTETDNLYYPLDDDFYSTINPDCAALNGLVNHQQKQQHLLDGDNVVQHQIQQATTELTGEQQHRNQNYLMAHCAQPEVDRADSRGSSTRSLARFLSLPARHSHHAQEQQQDGQSWLATESSRQAEQLNCLSQASKTIARTSQIERELTASDRNNSWELERHKLKFLDMLDEGQFGLVWRCKLKLDNKQEQIVAIKTLKSSASREERGKEELLAEIEIMKLVCGHPNVVKILHCCTKDSGVSNSTSIGSNNKPILLVMEYVELGKLQSFLESSRLNHHYATNQYNNVQAPPSDHLTSRDLIKFIYHVAKGMEYISSKCIVHRDLASRNILVSSQRICKIGDFGMARHMQSSSEVYERHSRNTKVPVRWMAPEVLIKNSFTSKSDVFSFGILMWEIVTLGSTPYRHLETEQVIEEVARNGQRPNRPDYCHPQLYEIMSTCWLQQPEQRPTFKYLVEKLDELLMSANDYIELDEYPDHNYYNIPKTSAPYELL